MTHKESLIAVAQAEDTYDLLNHIAWTDVIQPRLTDLNKKYTELLVGEALGTSPLPTGLTREKVAGICFGIKYVSDLFEQILKKGEKAFKDLQALGINLQ